MRPIRLLKPTAAGLCVALVLSGCTNPYDPGQRALGGAVIGAGTGAAIGGIAGGGRGAATGALIGGAVGAVGGAVTTPQPPPYQGYSQPPPSYQSYPQPAQVAWAPEMVWLPSLGVYVAMDYNYPLVYYGNTYYYLYSGYWYSGPTYRGPWRGGVALPPQLRSFQPNYWPNYQADARGYYHGNPGWRHFRPR